MILRRKNRRFPLEVPGQFLVCSGYAVIFPHRDILPPPLRRRLRENDRIRFASARHKEHEPPGVATFRVAGTVGRHAAFGIRSLEQPGSFSRSGHTQSVRRGIRRDERNGFLDPSERAESPKSASRDSGDGQPSTNSPIWAAKKLRHQAATNLRASTGCSRVERRVLAGICEWQ